MKIDINCSNCPFYEWEEHNNIGPNMAHVCKAANLDYTKLDDSFDTYTEIHPECPIKAKGSITVTFKAHPLDADILTKYPDIIKKLHSGQYAMYRDCEHLDPLLGDILFAAFPLKSKRAIFAPDRYFFGFKGTNWLGRFNSVNDLKVIKLSEIKQ